LGLVPKSRNTTRPEKASVLNASRTCSASRKLKSES
jgi:hypothetical protein